MWLILGGNGQLGKCLADALQSRDIAFVSVGRERCDITSTDSVNRVISDLHPAVVVNAAAWTAVDAAESNPLGAMAVNSTGASNVACACVSVGATLVHVSTDYVFSGQTDTPIAENAPRNPVSAYGKSKAGGEAQVIGLHPNNSYIIRTAWLYSRYGKNFAKTMAARALSGSPVRVVNDQIGQPTCASDLAEHIINLVSSGAPVGIYHGTNSGQASWHEFAAEIYSLLEQERNLVTPVPTSEYPTPAVRPTWSVLGHERTSEAGLPEMADWKSALSVEMPHIIAALAEEQ